MDFDSEFLEKETAIDSDNDSDPPLAHKAAAAGDVPLLVQAIKHDPGLLQQRDIEDSTALSSIQYEGNRSFFHVGKGLTPLAHAVQSQQLHAVKRLVKMGADIDSQDASGRTCLAVAAYQGWNDGVVYLLRKGANQSICDKSGRTPLHASTYDTDPKTLLSLLQLLSYSETNQTDNERMSALHWAAFHNRPEHLRLLLQHGAEVLVQDVDGKTPLHWATQNGCRRCCILLVEHDPESGLIQCTDNSGKTALHLAAAAGHHLILQDLARFLPDLYEAEDQDDRTPLHWAAAMGHAECVRTLLNLGVSPNPVDIDGGSPLEYAKQAGHKECCELLEERLGLRSFQSDINSNKSSPSLNTEKANKGAVGFLKGLFSKKQKEHPKEIKDLPSKVELPALNLNRHNGVTYNSVGALDSAHPIQQRAKKDNTNILTGANDKTGQECFTTSLHRLSIDAHTLDDNQPVKKQKKQRKRKKERHKHLREDGFSPTMLKTDSSTADDPMNGRHLQTHNSTVKSMHLSPLAGNVHTAALSPRSYHTNYEISTSKRLGELNPLRTGKLLNGSHEIHLPRTLATLRLDHAERSRSPTPPPPLSLNTKKALPEISPLTNEDETEAVKNRLRQKYKEVVNNVFLEDEPDSNFQW